MHIIHSWLEKATIQCPEKIALITKEGQFSYQWLHDMSNRFAEQLIQRCQAKPGDRIALMLPNNVRHIVAYYGILKIGAIVVPIHGSLKCHEMMYIFEDSEASILITDSSYLDEVEMVLTKRESHIEHCIVNNMDKPLDGLGRSFLNMDDFLSNCPNKPADDDCIKVTEYDIAVIFYTSGTMGMPKGVMISHRNIVQKMHPLNDAMDLTSEDRILCGLPIVYVYGQVMSMHLSIWRQSTLILLDEESVNNVLEMMENHNPTVMMSIPTTYYRLKQIDRPSKEKHISQLRYAITGGSNISIHLKKEFEAKYGIKLLDSYGLTETTACVIIEQPGDVRKPGSIGKPIANNDVQILDEFGLELPPGQIGEIAIRSKSVMQGYFKNELKQNESLKNGWFHTGDMAYQDINGNFFIVDRRKDIIQTAGFVVVPHEVEEVLSRHPLIIDSAVVGMPDSERGEIIKAYLVIKPGSFLSQNELAAYTRKYLAKFKCPTVFELVDKLPRNKSGKLLKRLLKEIIQ
ncbi:class I adenylate-forming enzyme family protein [Fictibacillus sp. FJAT-27399]|uniref:class I adenylate-forming enzyme family protein n=1 Tax=Fictibacillus sp. FJAT-27399 TaxID=1729689 RepID=UPI000784E2D2|nr:AMP-binding protein [Fictibacillus sp. FJAT-27399]